MKEGRSKVVIMKRISTTVMVRHCNRLPEEFVEALRLEVFKDRLNGV